MFKALIAVITLSLISSGFQLCAREVGLSAGQFRVDESGAATYHYPLNLPKGIAGVTPNLALTYSSHNTQQGPFGVGWSLSGASSIYRCPQTPANDGSIREVQFVDGDNEDKYCLDGQRLILMRGEYGADGSVYRTELGSFSLITAHGQADGSGPVSFTLQNKAGEVHYFGDVSEHQALNAALVRESMPTRDAFVEPGGVAQGQVAKIWAIKAITDIKSNYIVFNYNKPFKQNLNQGRFNLASVHYTGNLTRSTSTFARVEFNYQPFNKGRNGYQSGAYYIQDQLISDIEVHLDHQLYRYYQFGLENTHYIEDKVLLTAITECIDAAASHCLPSTQFDWQRPALVAAATISNSPFNGGHHWLTGVTPDEGTQVFDIDGDGRQDVIYVEAGAWQVRLAKAPAQAVSLGSIGAASPENALNIDYDGDGKRDLLVANSASEHWRVITFKPSLSDMDVFCIPNAGCSNIIIPREYTPVTLNVRAIGWQGSTQILDVNGDGFEEIVFEEGNQLKAYLNNGDGTFGDDEGAPTESLFNLNDLSPHGVDSPSTLDTMFTAHFRYASSVDINGDGRSDIVLKITQTQLLHETHPHCYPVPVVPDDCDGSKFNNTNFYVVLRASGTMEAPRFDRVDLSTPLEGMNNVRVVDFNGDGLTDIAYLKNGIHWYYRLSNGETLLPEQSMGVSYPNIRQANERKDLNRFVDLNGDGRTDVLHASSKTLWLVYYARPQADGQGIRLQLRGRQSFDSDVQTQFGDVNGDGKLDLLTATGSGAWKVYTNRPGQKEHVINRITNGHGVYTDITYRPMTNPKVYRFNGSDNQADENVFSPMSGMHLVSQVSTLSSDDETTRIELRPVGGGQEEVPHEVTVPAVLTVNYQYGGLLFHKKGRGNLGFQMLKTTDAQTQVETETHYSQGYSKAYWDERHFATARMPLFTRQSKNGVTLSEQTNTLKVQKIDSEVTGAGASYFAYIKTATENAYVYNSDRTSTQTNSVVTVNRFDDWGNVTQNRVTVTDVSSAQGHTLLTQTTNDFGDDNEQRFGRLQSTSVTKTRSDNETSVTRSSSFTYHPHPTEGDGLGMIKSTELHYTRPNRLTTHYEYDDFGNLTRLAKSGNSALSARPQVRANETLYSANGRYIKQKKNALAHTVEYTYNNTDANLVRGKINTIKTTQADGQYQVQYFNGFGRGYKTVSNVNQSEQVTELDYCATDATVCTDIDDAYYYRTEMTRARQSPSVQITPVQQFIYDRWGRVLAKRTKGFDNTWITQQNRYDLRGRLDKVYEPNSSLYYTQTHYDDEGLGEAHQITRIKQALSTEESTETRVSHVIAGLKKTTTDELGKQTSVTVNGFGETAITEDALGTKVSFTYDPFGNVLTSTTTVEGEGQSVVRTHYDNYGRKRWTKDPVKGTWQYTYNAFSEIYTQKDANSQMFTFAYDALGRKVRSYNIDEGTLCWFYDATADSDAAKLIGKLVHTAKFTRTTKACELSHLDDADISKSFTYYPNGLSREVITRIDTDTFTQSKRYDAYSRPERITYPSAQLSDSQNKGFSAFYQYNNHGYLLAIRRNNATGALLKTITAMDNRQQVTGVRYGNRLTLTKAYRADTGWLSEQWLRRSQTQVENKLEYEHYDNGHLYTKVNQYESEHNFVNEFKETYLYDDLYRLTDTNTAFSPVQHPTTKFSEDAAYRYDKWGNITSKTGVGYYKYHSTDKHRLLGIYQDSAFTQPLAQYQFIYDQGAHFDQANTAHNEVDSQGTLGFANGSNGNIVSDGRRYFNYTSFDKVKHIRLLNGSASSTMHYDEHRAMYQKEDCYTLENGQQQQRITTYLNGYEKIEQGTDVEHKYYVGADIVVTYKGRADTTHYLHKDHLGSVIAISNQQGVIVSEATYDPWGKRAGMHLDTITSGLGITDRGFTGHKHLEALNIIHMKGRIYDPSIGRFLQADPFIQAPNNSQSYNRYSYVLNNPLNYTDPSGYFFKSLFKKLNKALGKFAPLLGLALMAIPVVREWALASGWNAALFGFGTGGVATGSIKGAMIGALGGAVFHGIGKHFGKIGAYNATHVNGDLLTNFGGNWLTNGQVARQIASHAVAGGVISTLGGGKFGHGFFSAGVTKAAGGAMLSGGSDLSTQEVIGGTISSAVIGGTASVISGGKFANGAQTGAFQFLFNQASKKWAKKLNGTRYKNAEEFVKANHVKGKTVLLSGERDLNIGDASSGVREAFDAPMYRAMNIAGVHEHVWGIDPDGSIFNIGYGNEGLFFEDPMKVSEYKFHYMGSYSATMTGSFDYYNQAVITSGQAGLYNNDYLLLGNNCQNFTSQYFAGCN